MILDNVSLDDLKIAEFKRSISNWVKVSDMIYGDVTEADLLVMMKIEKCGKNRNYILSRLHSRFCRLRMTRERKELLKGSYL
jgi:hypothetical protein